MVVYIDYIKQVAKTNYIKWDVNTITAGDYTVEFEVTDQFYEDFKKKKGGKKPCDQSMGQYFKTWITEEMEDKLSKMTDLGYESVRPPRIVVAST